MVQSFYAHRIWRCMKFYDYSLVKCWYHSVSDKNPFLITFLAILLCTEFGANTAFYAIMCVSIPFLRGFQLTRKTYSRPMTSAEEWLTVTWLAKTVTALDAASGVLLAGLVIFLLHRNRTGFRRTESMINRLIVLTMNTGLLTSICAVMTLIFVRLPAQSRLESPFISISGHRWARQLHLYRVLWQHKQT